MESSFDLNKLGWYTPLAVTENEFLNKDKTPQEIEQYGKIYSVQFHGDAGTFLWSSRTEPEKDKKYYGHLELAKSGKSTWFRKDKPPENEPTPIGAVVRTSSTTDKAFLKDASTIPMDVYRVVANVRGLPENETDSIVFWEIVREHSNELLLLIDNVRNSDKTAQKDSVRPTRPYSNWSQEAADEL